MVGILVYLLIGVILQKRWRVKFDNTAELVVFSIGVILIWPVILGFQIFKHFRASCKKAFG